MIYLAASPVFLIKFKGKVSIGFKYHVLGQSNAIIQLIIKVWGQDNFLVSNHVFISLMTVFHYKKKEIQGFPHQKIRVTLD